MTTSISSEAQKLWMDIGQKFTTYNTINIKPDKIGKTRNPLKSRNLLKLWKLDGNM